MPRYPCLTFCDPMTNSAIHTLSVLTIPAFNDNYLWLIHDGTHAAVVDPGNAKPVLAALQQHGLRLTAILLTSAASLNYYSIIRFPFSARATRPSPWSRGRWAKATTSTCRDWR